MRTVTTAKTAGFCSGVRRAVELSEQAASEFAPCFMLNHVVHNEHVIGMLEEKGVQVVSDVSEVPEGSTVITRCHGIPPTQVEALHTLDANIIDTTCPSVKKVHSIVADETSKGRLPIIIGDKQHPEVIGIAGFADNYIIFDNTETFAKWISSSCNSSKPISVVFQTTCSLAVYEECLEIIKKECTNGKYFDTICSATQVRQNEAAELAAMSDTLFVIGGKNSSNGNRLAQLCKKYCDSVISVESADDVSLDDIKGRIGITAAASTPVWIIKEVTRKMFEETKQDDVLKDQASQESTIDNNDEQVTSTNDSIQEESSNNISIIHESNESSNNEESEAAVPQTETAAETANTTTDFALQNDTLETSDHIEAASTSGTSAGSETFEQMLEKSIKTIYTGEKVTGVITSITSTEVSVELGTKQSGYIPITEFTDDNNNDSSNVEEQIKVGDKIEAFVMRVNDVEGMVMLSKKRLDAVKNWKLIEDARDNKEVVDGVVTEENKGGVVVNVKGIRVFVPASQTGLPKTSQMSEILKQKVKLRITEVNQPRRRVIGSIRAVQFEERKEKINSFWNEIEVGKEYTGTVKSLATYGAFVDIGGVDGMVHISELSWTRIKQPSDVVSVGDEISVYVIAFDKEKRKISLGFKRKEDNPWARFISNYNVGDIVNVKIVKMMPFGAFAEVFPGVDGLIHISQISDRRIGLPSEVLSDGQQVDVKITEIDLERKKISLSINALFEPPANESDHDEYDVRDADMSPVVVYDTDAPPPLYDEDDESGELEQLSSSDTSNDRNSASAEEQTSSTNEVQAGDPQTHEEENQA